MTDFNSLVLQQSSIGEEIQTIVRNFKKDSASRKTKEYYKERSRRLQEAWQRFECTDNTIRLIKPVPLDHEYFTKDYYTEIMELTNSYQKLFERESNAGGTEGPLHNTGSTASGTDSATAANQPASSNIAGLIRKQDSVIMSLQRLVERLSQDDTTHPQQYFKVKINSMSQMWELIQDLHLSIWELSENPLADGYNLDRYIEMEDLVQGQLVDLEVRALEGAGNSHGGESTAAATHMEGLPQLPKVHMTKFDGDYLKWRQFHDMFYQLIDKQPLPAVQKLWYLKSNVSGDAERLIRHLPLTTENYESAWKLLQDRYNNERVIISAILQRLLEQPSVTSVSSSVRSLHDTTKECLLALNNSGIETSSWDPLLMHLLLKKLDKATVMLFEQSLVNPRELPTINTFLKYLEARFQSLETLDHTTKQSSSRSCHTAVSSVTTGHGHQCGCCKGSTHPLYLCKDFLQRTPESRLQYVKAAKLCLNCLKSGHFSNKCVSRGCTKCNSKHNTLLHASTFDKQTAINTSSSKPPGACTNSSQPSSTPVSLSTSNEAHGRNYVLLSTAVVKIISNDGTECKCRAILDSGSQVNLITERAIKKLGVRPRPTSMRIQGIGSVKSEAHCRVNVTLCSLLNGFSQRLEAFVLPQIIAPHPAQHFDTSSWSIPKNISLADPKFNQPGRIDLLLGAEFHHQLLSIGQIQLSKELPIIQNTLLGWVFSGKINGPTSPTTTCSVCTDDEEETLNNMIERFWKLEEVEQPRPQLSTVDKLCETHFTQHSTRTNQGRFMVRLPFKDLSPPLGDSKAVALNRFYALERRLLRNQDIRKQYIQFMSEYRELGHMTETKLVDMSAPHYFIPHHHVLKPDSSSTKLRVVFDASSKTTTGLSLNDTMFVGPTVQNELFAILLRFRMPRFVFVTDIEKMYRQVLVHPEDRRYQLIIWRENENDRLRVYQLNTVTYGTRAAPYLATRCLYQLSQDYATTHPYGSKVLETDFYVDDCLTGANSLVTTITIKNELCAILQAAGFKPRKWAANHSQLLEGLPAEDQEVNLNLEEDGSKTIKTLGISWRPKDDQFCIKVNPGTTKRITKRIVSGELASLFDPLGLLAPVVVRAKMFIQELWQLKVSWDEALPAEMHTRWCQFREELNHLNDIRLPRHIYQHATPKSIQIHAFGDASEKAYGAAIYVRAVCSNGTVIVRLLCAKSRVAPIKRQTIPRLELCAAVLCTQLANRVKSDIKLEAVPTFYWTDSTVVLAWINSCSSTLNTFEANRVTRIQESTLVVQWRHVSSHDNPADVVSRGIAPRDFKSCTLWLYGPFFLHKREPMWPEPYSKGLAILDENEPIQRTPISLPINTSEAQRTVNELIYTINHGNSFKKLQNVVAYILRFHHHTRIPSHQRQKLIQITPEELNESIKKIVQAVQTIDFKDEIKLLSQGRQLSATNKIVGLSPFMDNEVMRVGGRLHSSLLPYEAKHQMILPYNDPIVTLLMKMIHEQNKHCGPQTLLAITRQRFWPIKGKLMARSVTQHCIKCTKARPRLMGQVMGNLPATRITPARPFINTGVDYCGPFWTHFKVRGKRPQKSYLAIFCCFATKAIHIEVVSDLTTNAFLGALKRFMGRRGHVQNLYSDNATNFTGAENQLTELTSLLQSPDAQNQIIRECSQKGINFKFIPPRAPHFGGLWESSVKATKRLLLRSVSTASLTYEELETVIIDIEAILNSRPIAPMSDDPNDLAALTPGHLLIGEPLTASVDVEAVPRKMSLLTRWKLVTNLRQKFWDQWSLTYLNSLQQRHKWKVGSPNIKIGTMVIMKEDNMPPLQWPLGRIVQTYPGNDGHVRVVDVKTAHGIVKRAIHRLALLLPEPEQRTSPTEAEESDLEATEVSTTVTTGPSPPKRKRIPWSTYISTVMLMLLLPMALADATTTGPVHITKFSGIGIHFERIGLLKLTRSEWKIVVFYDLHPYWTEMATLNEGIASLQKLCERLAVQDNCKQLINGVKHVYTVLERDNGLLDRGRAKRGAVDMVGNIANSLFGILDSEYAKEMSKTIQLIRLDENHLVHLLRNQTSIVDSTINVFKENQSANIRKFDDIHRQINDIVGTKEEDRIQGRLFQDLISITVHLHATASNLQQTQSLLLDVLTGAQHGRINPMVLTTDQLKREIFKIKNHLPPSVQIPVDSNNIPELYKLMTIQGGFATDKVIFTISLPLVDTDVFAAYRVLPIPGIVNNKFSIMKLCNDYMAFNAHSDQYFSLSKQALHSCSTTKDNTYLCPNIQTKYSMGAEECSCELRIFTNETEPNCELMELPRNETWVQMDHPNNWMYSTKLSTRMTAVCGQNRLQIVLEGSGIIQLQAGCILKNSLRTIQAHHTVNSTVHTSYTRTGDARTFIRSDVLHQLTWKSNSSQYELQDTNITAIQKMIESQVWDLPSQMRETNKHHFATGYTALTLSIILSAYLIWHTLSTRHWHNQPIAAPRHQNPPTFSVQV